MIKILIAEDINTISIDIRNIIDELGYSVQNIVTTGEDVLSELEKNRPDLILLDTVLNGALSGTDTALKLREKYDVPIVFLSGEANSNTILNAKKAGAYGFVIKPFKNDSLKAAIEIALSKYEIEKNVEPEVKASMVKTQEERDYIFVRTDYKLLKVKMDEIYYVEAFKDYVIIYTRDNVITTHATMKRMSEVLPENRFIRIHRSYFVAFDKIHSFKFPDLIVEHKMKVLPVGGLYKKKLVSSLEII